VEKKNIIVHCKCLVTTKRNFVGAWTDEFLHFGNCLSSRAESAQVKLKKYLQVSIGDLYEVQSKICLTIQNEFNEIKVNRYIFYFIYLFYNFGIIKIFL
jgi:hypothetical protein